MGIELRYCLCARLESDNSSRSSRRRQNNKSVKVRVLGRPPVVYVSAFIQRQNVAPPSAVGDLSAVDDLGLGGGVDPGE